MERRTDFDPNETISSSLVQNVRSTTSTQPLNHLPLGRIAVSQKWKQTELVECLQKNLQVIFIPESSTIDFYPSDGVAVLYITEADCILNDGCRQKLAKLRNTRGVRGMVLFEKTPMTEGNFQSIQKFAVLDLGLVLLTVTNQADAAQLLIQMVGLENKSYNNPFQLKGNPPIFDDILFETIQAIPGLGQIKGRQLLMKYKSIKNISKATVEELTPLIGKSAALKVWQFFR